MATKEPSLNCYCNFCGTPLRFQISRVGEAVNCFQCGMETVLFIPGLGAPYPPELYVIDAREIRWTRSPFGVRHLEGVVENKSAKRLDWVRIEFILYTEAGLPVGSTSDCVTNLAVGGEWKFQAPIAQPEASRTSEPLLSCEY